MFLRHSKNGISPRDEKTNGIISRFPESLVNPMYKPRTLGELRALFEHTGINPAPVQLRDPIKEIDGIDAMDMPAVPVGGDVFDNIRTGKAIENDLRDKVDSYRANQKSQVVEPIKEPDKQAE